VSRIFRMTSVLCSVLLVAASVALAAGAPDAILSAVAGKVSVQNAQGKSLYVTGSMPLHAGERVFVGPNSHAKVIFPNRPPQDLQGGQNLLVGAAAVTREAAAGSSGPARLWGSLVARFRSSFLTERQAPPAASRDLGDLGVPRLLYPCRTAITDSEPVFRWTAVAGVDSYLFTVLAASGRRALTQVVQGTEYALPATVPPLTPGERYVWCVADARQPEEVSQAAWFELLAPGRREAYEQSVQALDTICGTDALLKAELAGYLAADYGLNLVAVPALEQALAGKPEDVALRRTLARLYETLAQNDKAQQMLDGLAPVPTDQQGAWQAVLPGNDGGQ
jgi:hypothetical protein